MPIRLSKFLAIHGTESIHVNQVFEGSSTPDAVISEYANKNDYIVITKDTDFRNAYLLKKTPRKLIRVCLGNISNDRLIELFDNQLGLITKLNQKDFFYLEIHADSIFIY
jgi:predicted nuclease of predicted toxin-antitoxin system